MIMASIITRNGILYAQFYDQDRSPARRRFSLKTDDRSLARQKLARWERAYQLGEWDPWIELPSAIDEGKRKRVQLQEAFSQFIEAKRLAGRAESTLSEYRWNVSKLVERVGEQKAPEAVSASHVRKYLQQGGVKASTQRKRYQLAKGFLSWCEEQGYLSTSPVSKIELPEQGKRIPQAVTLEELDRICTAVREDYKRKRAEVNLLEGDLIWMVPCFRFMAFTGLRTSEAGRLRWGHLSFTEGLIYIYEQKNQNEETIPLNDRARSVLERMNREPNDHFVFRSPRSDATDRRAKTFRHALARHFKRFKNMAGIDRDVTPHSLRHLFGFLLAQGGCSAFVVKEAMRHSSIKHSSTYVQLAGKSLGEQVNDALG
jgi:integrase/recombinase XerD